MVDLGLFNYIKNALSQGKSKDEIKEMLSHGKVPPAEVESAIRDVEQDNVPMAIYQSPAMKLDATVVPIIHPKVRPLFITLLCGYYLITWLMVIVTLIISLVLFAITDTLSTSVAISYFTNMKLETMIALAYFIFSVIAISGFWDMKRWAVFLYFIIVGGMLTYEFMTYALTVDKAIILTVTYFVPVLTVLTGFRYLKRMSWV
jgi:hypothetical protein